MTNSNAVAVQAIKTAAAKYGLDPQAMIAVARVESGLNPKAIGDGGHAFGLFQFNNAGGVITGQANPERYLDPSFNAMEAARHIASIKGAKGARGEAAVKLIVNSFERPANKPAEISKALSYLGQGGSTAPTIGSGPSQTAPNGSLAQSNTSGQTTGANPLESLLNYTMAGSAPSHSGAGNSGDILSVLLQQAGDQNVTAPTIGQTPSVGNTPSSAVNGTPALSGTGAVTTIKNPKIIGTPYHGTHTLGNWQSDNAVDIAMPKGTPLYAAEDGTIGSRIGALASKSPRMAGLRLTIEGKENSLYYAHLSKLAVKAGQQVKKGELIGYSGEANGVAHLHLGSLKGNPDKYA